MGKWRTVHLTGTMNQQDVGALWEHLGYSAYLSHDSALDHVGPLSFCKDTLSLRGIGSWPAEKMDIIGNLHARDYSVQDVAEQLRELVAIAPSMMLVIHCGGEWESLKCVATIRTGEGLVAVMKPEVEKIIDVNDDQLTLESYRSLPSQLQFGKDW